ncbi:zinc ribbon domain-containing protein [Halococcus sediminicola]|uniref:zinc ribbon domain-containing protein n=1 Tax=Halococcus sediminicola TaxID=1264579 RepID=UPI000678E802|nr:zinc ribbon domain-containing protein [Halococcus sediminicola]
MDTMSPVDPRCPECGEPIGMTSAFCIHCSADLTDYSEDTILGTGEQRGDMQRSSPSHASTPSENSTTDKALLDPDRLTDTFLTAAVGLVGGFIVGVLLLVFVTGMLSAALGVATGFLVWLGTTIYFARRRTVQEAVSKAAYGIALSLLLYSLIPFSSTWEANSLTTRLTDFVVLLVIVSIPVAIIAGVGHLARRFAPDDDTRT